MDETTPEVQPAVQQTMFAVYIDQHEEWVIFPDADGEYAESVTVDGVLDADCLTHDLAVAKRHRRMDRGNRSIRVFHVIEDTGQRGTLK